MILICIVIKADLTKKGIEGMHVLMCMTVQDVAGVWVGGSKNQYLNKLWFDSAQECCMHP